MTKQTRSCNQLIRFDKLNSVFSCTRPLLFNPTGKGNLAVYKEELLFFTENIANINTFRTKVKHIQPGWISTKKVSFEDFLNRSEFEDIYLVVNNSKFGVKREILLNFSREIGERLENGAKVNNFKFEGISETAMLNVLSFVYSNFSRDMSGVQQENLVEMFRFVTEYGLEWIKHKLIEVGK